MKKMLTVCTLVLLVLAVSSRTQASPTITTHEAVDVVDATSGQDDTYFLPSGGDARSYPYFRGYYKDWGWNHTFADPAALLPATIDAINWATLEIRAYNVQWPNEHSISRGVPGDLEDIGYLAAREDNWKVTTFHLGPEALGDLLDGTMDVWLDIGYDPGDTLTTMGSSTLTVNYDVAMPAPAPSPIPAPGAILLGSIGASVVGLLRRRRTL